jgi:hypothetical protein
VQATVDAAQRALTKAQVTLASTQAQNAATLQSAQNTLAQDQAVLDTQQAAYAVADSRSQPERLLVSAARPPS